MADELGAVTIADVKRLRHMLGATECYGVRKYGWRNYFASSGGESMASMERLVSAGLATKGESGETMAYYHATLGGCQLLGFTKAQIKRTFKEAP